jgi:hypothetical protein
MAARGDGRPVLGHRAQAERTRDGTQAHEPTHSVAMILVSCAVGGPGAMHLA